MHYLFDKAGRLIRRIRKFFRRHTIPYAMVESKGGVYAYKFRPEYFLPEIKTYEKETVNKPTGQIKVRLLLFSDVFWNSYKTLWEEFEKDDKYDTLIILPECFYMRSNRWMEEVHYKTMSERAYDTEIDEPDILIVTFSGTDEILAPRLYQHIGCFDLIVAATGELIVNMPIYTIDEGVLGYQNYKPDFYLMDSLLYNLTKKIGVGWKVYEAGNCKYDLIFNDFSNSKENTYPQGWEKLRGKKVFLYATDHGFYGEKVFSTCTFDIYAKHIFEYAKEHLDVGFIIRLHPTFFLEMSRNRVWSRHDLSAIYRYCMESPNVVWDKSSMYNNAYKIADAIIVDAYCGMIASSLPLEKPVCALERSDISVKSMHSDLLKTYYHAKTPEQLIAFMDTINSGIDKKRNERIKMIKKCIMHFDGNNGCRMKELIESKYFEKIKGMYD